MKIVAFNGSPHGKGTTSAGLSLVCEELENANVEVEALHVGGKAIHGCMGCGKCHRDGLCAIKDDSVNEYIEKVRLADGIILASPVYYGGIAGGFKCLLDRMFFTGLNLFYKPAAALVVTRRSGAVATYHQLCNYLTLAGTILTPTVYWNNLYGASAEDTWQDGEGIYTMRCIGRNMAWLLNALDAGKKTAPLPDLGPRVWTNFIH
jgi:multimeric flavodoxin WrbA